MKLGRLVAVAAGILGGVLVYASPAQAADIKVPIKADQVPMTADEFAPQQCDGPFDGIEDGEEGWHFVLTQYDGDGSGVTFSLVFDDGQVDVTDGFVESGGVLHLWYITDAGKTLVDAGAMAPEEDLGEDAQFNLSHTCPGVPGGSPSPSPSATPSATPSPGVSEQPTPTPSETPEGSSLPTTGAGLGGMLVLAGGLLAAGVAMVAVRRRKLMPLE